MTLVVNAGPNRIDPSRTLTLRRQLSGIISRQFASIRAELYRLVVDEDAFGLRHESALPSSVDGVFNAFCPTGEGGGIDNSCGRSDTSTIRQAIDDYSQLTYEQINEVMRGGGRFKGVAKKDALKIAGVIAQAFDDPKIFKTTKKTEVVHRGISSDKVFRSLSKLKEGDTFADKAFVSTSRDWEIAKAAAENLGQSEVILRVFLPRGTKYVNARSDEKEILLEPGTRMKVLKSDRAEAGHGHRKPTLYLDVEVQKKRVTANAFYPTGEGGGIDPTVNAEPGRFAFASSDAKVKEFGSWIEQQYRLKVRSDENDEVWRKFIEKSFKKGAGRAYDDFMKGRKERGVDDRRKLDFYAGGRDEFLRSGFANPMQIDRLKILAARTYTDIQGATEESATKMRRALVEGLAQGKGPREIADRMSRELSVAKWRALRIARTEIVRAHAEGQLNAFEKLGVNKVGAKVEWQITRLANGQPDPRVCELCGSMAGKVFKIKDARGRIPAHPNCRCAWLPVIEEAKKPKLSKKRPKPKPKKAPPPAPARKRPTKDDRPDELDRLEITFGKKKIAIIRDPRAPAKPKGKARPKRKPPKKRSPAPKSKKAAIRKSGKKTKPKPTSTTRRGAKKTVRKKATTPKRPVARSRQKAGPTAKKRPTRNELYPELIQFSRVIGNVFCPTGEGGGVDPTRNEESS